MDSMSKNVYIENLADIVNKYNNLHHSTIIMTSVDVKSSIYTYKYQVYILYLLYLQSYLLHLESIYLYISYLLSI